MKLKNEATVTENAEQILKPKKLNRPITISILTITNITLAIFTLWLYASPTPELRSTIEARKLVESQVKLEELKLEQEIVIYQQARMEARDDSRCILENL